MTESRPGAVTAALAGFVRIVGAPPAFVLPVFRRESGLAVQEIDDSGSIIGFLNADTSDAPLILPSTAVEKAVGAPCLIAYELSEGTVHHGTPDEVRAKLGRSIDSPAFRGNAFSKWEVAIFCGRTDIVKMIMDQLSNERSNSRSLQYFLNVQAGDISAPTEFQDLDVFRDRLADDSRGPEMVVIPKGDFLMGSPENEEGRYSDEGPQHKVTIGARFALGRYPLTVGEYGTFVEATGHRHEGGMYVWTGSEWKQDAAKSWRDPGFVQTDRSPVVGVNWRDAVAYCEWLAKATGQPYRLPSEAEWEYACRAGSTTRYAWGDAITEKDANFARKVGKTTEVGAYPANRWGLYDMHGNVWEWVEDVWHDTYRGAPDDGSAWTEGEGNVSSRLRVNRGGSWYLNPRDLRSATRSGDGPGDRSSNQGFRVARTLS